MLRVQVLADLPNDVYRYMNINELVNKPEGYRITALGDEWVRVVSEDSIQGRAGYYLNIETSECHHAEDMFRPENGSKYMGRAIKKKRKE